MEVEVWADVVCPWCFIGKRKLDLAIKQLGEPVTVIQRAFQLDPSAKGSKRTVDMLVQKYGRSEAEVKQMMGHVTSVAAEVGLEYHLDRTLSGNTRDAHRLLKHAGTPAAWEHFYQAYFRDGRSLFDHDALGALAKELGITDAKEVLASDRYAQEVNEDLLMAREIGVSGVPFFVVERRLAASGAQPVETLVALLKEAM
jgi:predicted DsbA family dithiol-disulfide isomerase